MDFRSHYSTPGLNQFCWDLINLKQMILLQNINKAISKSSHSYAHITSSQHLEGPTSNQNKCFTTPAHCYLSLDKHLKSISGASLS